MNTNTMTPAQAPPDAIGSRPPIFSKQQIWKLLIPLMIEQVLTSLMGTVDTMMVSRLGEVVLSAVGLFQPLKATTTLMLQSI